MHLGSYDQLNTGVSTTKTHTGILRPYLDVVWKFIHLCEVLWWPGGGRLVPFPVTFFTSLFEDTNAPKYLQIHPHVAVRVQIHSWLHWKSPQTTFYVHNLQQNPKNCWFTCSGWNLTGYQDDRKLPPQCSMLRCGQFPNDEMKCEWGGEITKGHTKCIQDAFCCYRRTAVHLNWNSTRSDPDDTASKLYIRKWRSWFQRQTQEMNAHSLWKDGVAGILIVSAESDRAEKRDYVQWGRQFGFIYISHKSKHSWLRQPSGCVEWTYTITSAECWGKGGLQSFAKHTQACTHTQTHT